MEQILCSSTSGFIGLQHELLYINEDFEDTSWLGAEQNNDPILRNLKSKIQCKALDEKTSHSLPIEQPLLAEYHKIRALRGYFSTTTLTYKDVGWQHINKHSN